MSLLDTMMTECAIMDKRTASDGEGGYVTTYEDGATIKCAIVLNTSLEAQVAEHDGVKDVYKITTLKSVILGFHDVVKRLSDGKTFRVTSNGLDSVAPDVSTIKIAQVTAEAWDIPKE